MASSRPGMLDAATPHAGAMTLPHPAGDGD
jgi:hypothetical protein